jgi:hypothetical protein
MFPPHPERRCLGQLQEVEESKCRRLGKALKRQVK